MYAGRPRLVTSACDGLNRLVRHQSLPKAEKGGQ
jgi:hypothetical protein